MAKEDGCGFGEQDGLQGGGVWKQGSPSRRQ